MPPSPLDALERDAAELMEGAYEDPPSDDAVSELAARIFGAQAAACPAVARLADARGIDPEAIEDWREIPAIPTRAFRSIDVRAFPADEAVRTFRTSGTTGPTRGRHAFRSLDLYRRAVRLSVRHDILPDREEIACVILHPSPEEAPDSSLAFMFDEVRKAFGTRPSRTFVDGGVVRVAEAASHLRRLAERNRPVLVLATAFALADLLEGLADPLVLPDRSRVVQTGGFKGKRREVELGELQLLCHDLLGVPSPLVAGEYGMTELTSQAHDDILRAWVTDGEPAQRMKRFPPWARVTARDPETLEPLEDGEVGLLAVLDLANVGSAVRVQTEDLGWTDGPRFDILGRAEDADLRGCSLLIEELSP